MINLIFIDWILNDTKLAKWKWSDVINVSLLFCRHKKERELQIE